jgi:hypothetical protein
MRLDRPPDADEHCHQTDKCGLAHIRDVNLSNIHPLFALSGHPQPSPPTISLIAKRAAEGEPRDYDTRRLTRTKPPTKNRTSTRTSTRRSG